MTVTADIATEQAQPVPARPLTPDEIRVRTLWRERIQQAREAQKPFVPTWRSNLAFAAGQFWLEFDRITGEARSITLSDPRFEDTVPYTADRINEYRQAQLGELEAGDDRQQLLTAHDGEEAEEIAKALNDAVEYAWEHEWGSAAALRQARRYVIDLGVAAIRCRRDATKGPASQAFADPQTGQIATGPADIQALAQNGTLADGRLPLVREVPEGRSVWDVYSAFQVLAPPGCNHEDVFPWEVLVRPVPIDDVQAEYGAAAASLREDTDIASAMGLTTSQTVRDSRSQGTAATNRLRGHVWLYTCFQRPNRRYPRGQVVVLASNDYVLLDSRDQLDYRLPNGDWHTGITYLHWWRLNDRFYSRSFIEPMKDPQRSINELETTANEIIARGGPKAFVQKGSLVDTPRGLPLEKIEVDSLTAAPIFHPGIGPGPWMDVAKARHEANLAHASTLSQVRLGENPQNVDTYSQLALINELEAGKRTVIVSEHRAAVALLEELGVWDIRKWWPEQKTILVTGEDDRIAEATFRKSQIPDFYMVRVPEGSPQPRSQAAEIKKIDAIWAALVQCGLAVKDPDKYGRWYFDSIKAGQALDLPEPDTDSQARLAEFENTLMLQGETVQPTDYDLLPTHLPVHREAQDQARAAGDVAAYQRIEQHIQASIQQQQLNAAKLAAQQAPLAAASPVQPPGLAGAGAPQPQYVATDFQRLAQGA